MGLIEQLKPHFEIFCLVQFPETLKTFEALGVESFLYRDALGWEHGNLKRLSLSDNDTFDTYETRHYGNHLDWEKLHASITRHAAEVIESLGVDTIFLWNGHTEPMTSLREAAVHAECQVFFLERGFFPNSLFIDPVGTNAKASIAHRTTFNDKEAQLGATIQTLFKNSYQPIVKGRYDHTSQTQWSNDSSKYLFIEQVDHDTNIVLFCDKFNSNISAIQHYERTIPECSNNLLIKRHPENTHLKEPIPYDRYHESGSTPLQLLLLEADCILTRNSSVGLEGLIFDKPVAVLGTSIYSRYAFNMAKTSKPGPLPQRPGKLEGDFLGFLGELFLRHHIFTGQHEYPSTEALAIIVQSAKPKPRKGPRGSRRLFWRHPVLKQLGVARWSVTLALRSWRSKER